MWAIGLKWKHGKEEQKWKGKKGRRNKWRRGGKRWRKV